MAYIKKEVVIDKFEKLQKQAETMRDKIYLDGVLAVIENIPTEDVQEVRHGYWLDNIQKLTSPAGVTKDYFVSYKCSVCGRTENRKEPYCNCGAKMDGGKAE